MDPLTDCPSDTLRRARDLIASAGRFVKEAATVDRFSRPTFVDDPSAIRFDPFGAIERVAGDNDDLGASCYEYFLQANSIGLGGMAEWCRAPDLTWQKAISAFDAAIRMAVADGR